MSDAVVICGGGDGEWSPALVVLSCIVAVGGSFAALDCADRMRAADRPLLRRRYCLAGASLMGLSIWTMHFVGMLALDLGVPVNYEPVLNASSVAAAAFGSGLAFLIVNGRTVTRFHIAIGGVALGVAIAAMHYLGMASMRLPVSIQYDPLLFATSIGIAIAASAGALGLGRRRIAGGSSQHWVKTISAMAMGAAILGMHYVGMAAARYAPAGSTIADQGAMVGDWSLQYILVAAGVIILVARLALAAKNSAERQLALDALEAKRAEAVAASRAKDTFLASLSHELRTPLNPALLLASDAAANPHFPPAAREAFDKIARSISLEARLIDDLLDLTRISRGLLKIEPRVIDVHPVLRDAVAVVRATLETRLVDVAVDLAATDAHVEGDPVRLQQVFWNLLQNAAKFSQAGGRIGVRTANRGGWIEVTVTDSGVGMSAAELERCFEPFVQGGHQRGGLGLGLSISRSLVELHGGNLLASSPGPGGGATFTLRLKTTTAPTVVPASAPMPVATAAAGRSLTLLLVEDHEPSRTTMQHLLSRRGFEVVAVGSLRDALAAAENVHHDLLVSDIGLPDGSGHDLMRVLGQRNGLIGIAITGYGMDEDLRLARAAGFAAHITKPVTARQLEAAIAQALAGIPSESVVK
jgi:signal transduction histidine kinase/ActR/RegA family two-component response regulator